MAANCGWPLLSLPTTLLKHSLLRLFFSSKSYFQNTVEHMKGISYYLQLSGDVISVQGLADVANIWERLPRNSDHQPHTPEYWVIFEGGGSLILLKWQKSKKICGFRQNDLTLPIFKGVLSQNNITMILTNLLPGQSFTQVSTWKRNFEWWAPLSEEVKVRRGC